MCGSRAPRCVSACTGSCRSQAEGLGLYAQSKLPERRISRSQHRSVKGDRSSKEVKIHRAPRGHLDTAKAACLLPDLQRRPLFISPLQRRPASLYPSDCLIWGYLPICNFCFAIRPFHEINTPYSCTETNSNFSRPLLRAPTHSR